MQYGKYNFFQNSQNAANFLRNFVTGVAAAYWAHTPVVVITPETGSLSNGLGGFQETNQLPIFSEITKYQAHVCSPKRMAELTDRCFNYAMLERGPVQVTIQYEKFSKYEH